MCYKLPGPRCSSFAWGERVDKGLARVTAAARLDQAKAEAEEWRKQHPNMAEELPLDVAERLHNAEVDFNFADNVYRRSHKDWERTPHGLNTMAYQIGALAGDVSPVAQAEYAKAKANLEAVLSAVRAVEEKGEKPSAALKEEQKKAFKEYYDTVRESNALFFAKVAHFANQNPAKYGLEGNLAHDKIDMSDMGHVKALLDYVSSARQTGKVRDGNGVAVMAHHLSTAATERNWTMRLVKGELGKKAAASDEPMDTHRPYTAEQDEYVRDRMSDESNRHIVGEEQHGNTKGATKVTVGKSGKVEVERDPIAEYARSASVSSPTASGVSRSVLDNISGPSDDALKALADAGW